MSNSQRQQRSSKSRTGKRLLGRGGWLAALAAIAAIIVYSWMQLSGEERDAPVLQAQLDFTAAETGFHYGIPLDPARIKTVHKSVVTAKGEFFIFVHKHKDGFYAGAEIGGQTYELAQVGYGPNPEMIDLAETALFGSDIVRVEGYCGAACPTVDYIAVDDGYPYIRLHVDAGVQQFDLDQDGQAELIATVGTPLETSIYRETDGRIERASVNSALHSLSVSFFQDGRFIAYEPNSSLTRSYHYADGSLVSQE